MNPLNTTRLALVILIALSLMVAGCETAEFEAEEDAPTVRVRSLTASTDEVTESARVYPVTKPTPRETDRPEALSFIPRDLPAPSSQNVVKSDEPSLLVRDEPFTNAYFHYDNGEPIIVITNRLGHLILGVSWRAAEEKLMDRRELPIGMLTRTDVAAFQANPYHLITPRPYATTEVRELAYSYAHALSTYVLAHEYGHFALGHLSAASAKVGADNDVTHRARLSISRLQELEADSAAVSIVNTALGRDVATQGLILNTSLLLACEHVLGPSDPYTSDHPYWEDRLKAMLAVLEPRPSRTDPPSSTGQAAPKRVEPPPRRAENSVRVGVMGVVGEQILLSIDGVESTVHVSDWKMIGPYQVAQVEYGGADHPVVVFRNRDEEARCEVGSSVVLQW